MSLGTRARQAAALVTLLACLSLAGPAWGAETRVVGGQPASISSYPWQVALVFDPSEGGNDFQRQFCGGSLLTSRIVLTAAHCVYDTDPDCGVCSPANDPGGDGTAKLDPNDVDVILDRTTLTASGGTEVDASFTDYNDSFNPFTLENDTGYISLGTGMGAGRIKLAGADEAALWSPGRQTEISGWGATAENGQGSNGSDSLMAAVAPIIADSSCSAQNVYGSEFDPATMVCAGYLSGGVDTCYGDSGGPLAAPAQGGVYRLVGVTSWGNGCARNNAPGVYSRVAGTTLRNAVASDVFAIESAEGLAHESVVGTGAQPPPDSPPPPPPPPPPPGSGGSGDPGASSPVATQSAPATQPAGTSANPYARCKRIESKKKRKRCIRRVRATLGY